MRQRSPVKVVRDISIDVEVVSPCIGAVAIRLFVNAPRISRTRSIDTNSPDEALLKQMTGIGFRRSDALLLLMEYGIERARRNIDYTTRRQRQGGVTANALRHAVTHAIRHDVAHGCHNDAKRCDTEPGKETPTSPSTEATSARHARWGASRRAQAWQAFDAQSAEQKEKTWSGYLDTLGGARKGILWKPAYTKGLGSMAVRVDFLNWLADRLSGSGGETDCVDRPPKHTR